jgi:hypothetical protein
MKMARWISIVLLISNLMWCSNSSVQPIINKISIVTSSLSSAEKSAENSEIWFGWLVGDEVGWLVKELVGFTAPAMKHWGIILDIDNKVDNHHFEQMVELTILKETNTVKVKFHDWDDGEEETWKEKYGGFQKFRFWPELSNEIKSYKQIVYNQDWIDKYVDNFNRQNSNYRLAGNNCQKFVVKILKDITGESEGIIVRKIRRHVGTPVTVYFGQTIIITIMVASLWCMDVSRFYLILFSFTQLLALFCWFHGYDERVVGAGAMVVLSSMLLVYFYITAYTMYCIFKSIYNQLGFKEALIANLEKVLCCACLTILLYRIEKEL